MKRSLFFVGKKEEIVRLVNSNEEESGIQSLYINRVLKGVVLPENWFYDWVPNHGKSQWLVFWDPLAWPPGFFLWKFGRILHGLAADQIVNHQDFWLTKVCDLCSKQDMTQVLNNFLKIEISNFEQPWKKKKESEIKLDYLRKSCMLKSTFMIKVPREIFLIPST